MDATALAATIDQTLLDPAAITATVAAFLAAAEGKGYAAVCVQPCRVAQAARYATPVATVVGFPHGATSPAAKAAEARQAVADGGAEVDMVINRGRLVAGELTAMEADIAGVVAAGIPVKVILETSALSDAQIVAGACAAEAAGVAFVKTSTGYGGGGATEAAVRLLRATVGDRLGVKAAGGIRTLSDARAMLAAGATRLGTSRGAEIVAEARGEA